MQHSKNNRLYQSDFIFRENAKYINPYHVKMHVPEMSHLVITDNDAEKNKGQWNQQIFQANLPIHLEIGCGYGDFMERFCSEENNKINDGVHFIGIDYRFKRMFKLAKRIMQMGKGNNAQSQFRLIRGRGERIEYLFAPKEIHRCYLFFPDPWPKERHHKNRLIQKEFLDALSVVLEDGGEFWFKTDHPGLYDWALECFKNHPAFSILYHSDSIYSDSILEECFKDTLANNLYRTKFETLFLKQNLPIHGIVAKNHARLVQ